MGGPAAEARVAAAADSIAPYVRFADYATRRPWRTGPLCLFDYLLVHVEAGTMLLRAGGIETEIPAGAFCLVQPCPSLELEGGDTITPFLRFDVFYDPRRAERRRLHPAARELPEVEPYFQPPLRELADVEVPVVLRPRTPVLFAATLQRAVRAWLEGDLAGHLEANALTGELVAAILRDHVYRSSVPRSRLDWVDSYVTSRIGERVTLPDLARRARMSRSQFARLFKAEYGLTPLHYVMRLRIRRAQDMLRDTSLVHERIATYCGFSDPYHFSKAFKRHTGVSPRDYRRAYDPRTPRQQASI